MSRPSDDWFSLEESAALLRAIFPHYPDMRGMQPVPQDLKAWLREYREKHGTG